LAITNYPSNHVWSIISNYFTQSLPTYFVKPRFLRTFAFSKNDSPNLHIIKKHLALKDKLAQLANSSFIPDKTSGFRFTQHSSL